MPIDARLGLLLGLMVVALAGLLSAQPRNNTVFRPGVAVRSGPTAYENDWARVPRTGQESGPRYRVQEGDTLASIAERYYGDRHKSGELFRLNRDAISDPACIVPGTLLRVPGPADAR
jgi:nucleoid-associated protein YgaU